VNGGYFAQAGEFLVATLLGLYGLAVLLRFLLQLVRADFYNPFTRALVSVTNPVLRPLRRVIPGLFGLDLAALVLVVLIAALKITLVLALYGRAPTIAGLLVLAVADAARMTTWVFLGAIFARVILSWVAPYARNPVASVLVALTEPLMRPIRRWLPAMGGLDLSPAAVGIALVLVQILLVQPVEHLGQTLMR